MIKSIDDNDDSSVITGYSYTNCSGYKESVELCDDVLVITTEDGERAMFTKKTQRSSSK